MSKSMKISDGAEMIYILISRYTQTRWPRETWRKRLDGVASYPWFRGRCRVWDISAINLSSAANRAKNRQRQNHSELTDCYIFQTLAFETTGTMGLSTREFVDVLSHKLSVQKPEMQETICLRKLISLAIVWSNAASIRPCVYSHPS